MIYITGAKGRLGKEVAKLFPEAKLLDKGDRLDFHDAQVIIHLAGSLNFSNLEELYECNVGYTRQVLAPAPKSARIIFASSVSVYGKQLAEMPANEKTPCNPDTAYAKSKYEAEQLVLQRGNSIVLRIAAIYGPQFKDYFMILDRLAKGKMRIIGNGNNHVPLVHVSDVALAFKQAVKAKPGLYLISGEALIQKEIYGLTAALLSVPAPEKCIPAWLTPILVLLGKLGSEQLAILSSDRVFDCSKAKKLMGFKPRRLKDGLKEMVRLYRSANQQY